MSRNSLEPSEGEDGDARASPITTETVEPEPAASLPEAAEEQEKSGLDDADENAAVLRALVESAPDLVIHVDRQGRIRFINRLAQGFRREDVIGTEWLAFVGSDQHETLCAALQKTLTTGQTTEIEVLGQGDEGAPTWYWTRIAAVQRGGQVSGAVLLARDITQKKQAETQLVVSERMASLGMLAAGVAHELNNPLVSVIANLELALRDVARSTVASLPVELPEILKDARDGAERVRHIVRDLRIFSRQEGEERGPVQVERVLESTLRMAATEIRHRARLVTSYADVPPVDGSEVRLGQVFLNLIVNAAQALPEGRFEANEIRVTTSLDEHGRVLVSIADTGPGIPVEVQRRMFTPFFTTKPAGVGTGLGLCICQRIVTSLGGKIWFESMSGRGTVFRVLLPPAAKAASKPATEKPVEPPPTRRGRLLVIDDDASVTRAVKRLLEPEHDVSVADAAASALEALAGGQRFDVILCDLMMPQVTGMDFFSALQRIDPEQARRVVFLTGGAFTPAARQFLVSVANSRLEKPLDPRDLRAAVGALLK
ncbi:MAG TPA: ATP-binding protein [Polyangiaceae bacterium]|nr:ATP-binding protein [Polyangiaceae bacterium]